MNTIPFNRSWVGEREFEYVREAMQSRVLTGDGTFTQRCQVWLRANLEARQVLLTHSATGALEMTALLSDLAPGDEVIMPSFTFVSTANAIVLRQAVPVFIDIREDTLNLDETLIEAAITPRTRAIVAVHYAGVACEMDEIVRIARKHSLLVVEDAAQALMATYKGRPLGAIGDMGALSFHGTKNVHCGEGGAFITSSPELAQRAEIVREKGTNRSRFFRGEVDKYSWVADGSSYLPSEMNAAFLLGQLEDATAITERRLTIWNRYHEAFAELECAGCLRRPIVPSDCGHNAHIYYLLLPDAAKRDAFMARLKDRGIGTTFHYVPLHDTEHAASRSRTCGSMERTVDLAARLARLPLWPELGPDIERVIDETRSAVQALC